MKKFIKNRDWHRSPDEAQHETEEMANLLDDLTSGSWNPYANATVSPQKLRAIAQRLPQQARKKKMTQTTFRIAKSVAWSMGVLMIIGLFWNNMRSLDTNSQAEASSQAETSQTSSLVGQPVLIPFNVQFADEITLRHYHVTVPQPRNNKNRTIEVNLSWESERDVSDDLKLFVHLYDSEGNLVAQRDLPFFDGLYDSAATAWQPNAIISQRAELFIAEDEIKESPYQLVLGLYQAETGERLPVTVNGVAVEPENDWFVIAEFPITDQEWSIEPDEEGTAVIKSRRDLLQISDDQILLIQNNAGIAAINFDVAGRKRETDYQWRYFDAQTKTEQRGQGHLKEQDGFDNTSVEVADMVVQWSYHGSDSGWIYLYKADEILFPPSNVLWHDILDESDIDSIDLISFLTELSSDNAYPAPSNTMPQDPYPATGASNTEKQNADAVSLLLDKPLLKEGTVVTGIGPPGLAVYLLNITFMGEELGRGLVGADGTFSIQVNPLPAGIRIGLAADIATMGLNEEDVRPGTETMLIPQVGYFYDTLLTDE